MFIVCNNQQVHEKTNVKENSFLKKQLKIEMSKLLYFIPFFLYRLRNHMNYQLGTVNRL